MGFALDPMEFARIAESLRSAPSPTRTAEEIVSYVRQQLDTDHAGITLIRGRRELETAAANDPLVNQADACQAELD